MLTISFKLKLVRVLAEETHQVLTFEPIPEANAFVRNHGNFTVTVENPPTVGFRAGRVYTVTMEEEG